MPMLVLLACTPAADSEDPLGGLTLVTEDPSDAPIAGLDADWLERFFEGDTEFETPRRETQGLGPAYIRDSCAGCHSDDGRGPGTVIKMVVPDDEELDAELLPHGHTERPYVAGGAVTPLLAPDDDRVLVSTRQPPPVFGRGYLEAVSDDTILALEAEQAAAGVVSGRPNWVTCDFEANPDSLFFPCEPGTTVIGRFGLKARVPTLDGFSADAYQGDMAMTSPMRPTELPNPDGLSDDTLAGVDLPLDTVNVTADYMRLLALPRVQDVGGVEAFTEVGCAECHRANLPVRADWPIPQVTDARIYTDLLLHDMGPSFSDGLADYDAAPSEWRTAPLVGLRFLKTLLHDGRARSVEDAIVQHGAEGSEAAESVQAFEDHPDRAAILRFVESL